MDIPTETPMRWALTQRLLSESSEAINESLFFFAQMDARNFDNN